MCGIRTTLASVSIAALLVSSCAKKQELRPPEPYEGPVNVEVLRSRTVFSTVGPLRSEVEGRAFRGDDKLGSFNGVFLYEPPGSMRLRAFDPFGSTAMDMVSSGGMMQIYVPSENVLYEGEAPAFGMPADAVYAIELGGQTHVLYAFEQSGGELLLKARFAFDSFALRNTAMDVFQDGSKFMAAEFGSFSGPVPEKIRMSFFNGFSLELTLKDPGREPGLPADYFLPVPREGKRVLPLRSLLLAPSR